VARPLAIMRHMKNNQCKSKQSKRRGVSTQHFSTSTRARARMGRNGKRIATGNVEGRFAKVAMSSEVDVAGLSCSQSKIEGNRKPEKGTALDGLRRLLPVVRICPSMGGAVIRVHAEARAVSNGHAVSTGGKQIRRRDGKAEVGGALNFSMLQKC
jgi:hypothetical protein